MRVERESYRTILLAATIIFLIYSAVLARPSRELLIPCLESLGYRVLAASNGPLAIEMIEKNSDIELLMLDIAMPEMNGIEVARVVV